VRRACRIGETFWPVPGPTQFLHPIRIIREQGQNIVTDINADKSDFIGFLFPIPRGAAGQ
jgi:hypothetical protein